MSTQKPGERTPGKRHSHNVTGAEQGRKGGIASGKVRRALAEAGRRVWTKNETLEHMDYARAALAQPIPEHVIVRSIMHQFNQVRVGPDGNARNPITKTRAKKIIARVFADWAETYTDEAKKQQQRAITLAYDVIDMAKNGRVRTVGEGDAARTFVTKPSTHGYVQAVDHLARLQGTYAPEKNDVRLQGDMSDSTLNMIAGMSDREKRMSFEVARERYPHLFPDNVRPK